DVGERASMARRAARIANASDPKPVPAWLVEEGLALIRVEPPKSVGQGEANKQWKQLKRLATRCLEVKPQAGAAQAGGAGENSEATFEGEEASWRPQALYLRGYASIYLSLAESNEAARLKLLDEALADFRAAGDEKYQTHPDYAEFLVGWSAAHLSSAFYGDHALQFVNIKQAVRIAKRATELPANRGADVFNALGNSVEDEAEYLGESSKFNDAAAAFTNAINQATLAIENRNKAKMGLARTLYRQVLRELDSGKVEQHEERLAEALQQLEGAMNDFRSMALAAESRQWAARIRRLQAILRQGTPKFDEAIKAAAEAFKASDEFAEKNQVAQRHVYHWERQLMLAEIERAAGGTARERIDALLGPLLANSREAGEARTVSDADVVDVANQYLAFDLVKAKIPANTAFATYLKSLKDGTSKTELGTLARIRASVGFDGMSPESWVVAEPRGGLRASFLVAAQPLLTAHETDLNTLPDSLERRRVAAQVAMLKLAAALYLKPLDKTSDWGEIRDARDLLAKRIQELDGAHAQQREKLRGAVEAVGDRPAEWNDALAVFEPQMAENAIVESIPARMLVAAATRAFSERSGLTVDARERNARPEVRALLAPIERRHLGRFKKYAGDLATWLDQTRGLLR
ncbi:MAG TPA: hypothetical protein PLV92_18150, partial [Pirellulaceae bacterium]|nr:hypothetical protein [Pirellulaceae bacterium]